MVEDSLFDLVLDSESSMDELDSYLLLPRQDAVLDPIKYWQSL